MGMTISLVMLVTVTMIERITCRSACRQILHFERRSVNATMPFKQFEPLPLLC
jgi:hypothetical protein